jgi:hypothetical protein
LFSTNLKLKRFYQNCSAKEISSSWKELLQSQGFTEEAMIRMNQCQLAFHALTIANVLSGDGTKVTQEAKSIQ